MDSGRFVVALLLLSFATSSLSEQFIRMPSVDQGASVDDDVLHSRTDDASHCESWKYAVETNNAGVWSFPKKCAKFVQEYMTGERYLSDSEVVADYALEYAKSVNIAGDGKDAWIFDIDETLLSNLGNFANHEFGLENFSDQSLDESVELPALPASLRLYNELQQLGFKIFLLTGRNESQREFTDKNIQDVGYTNYEKLILRSNSDLYKSATLYKSERRLGLKTRGYRIHGNSGDQWTDLLGFAIATRSFKLPNPMYYVP